VIDSIQLFADAVVLEARVTCTGIRWSAEPATSSTSVLASFTPLGSDACGKQYWLVAHVALRIEAERDEQYVVVADVCAVDHQQDEIDHAEIATEPLGHLRCLNCICD
jgi:hypothetical protein